MGQSAGAGSIMHQITSYGGRKPRAPFRQAILQSSGVLPVVTRTGQEATFQNTLKHASLVAGRQIISLQQLRKLTFEQLHAVNYLTVARSPYGMFTFGPSIDKQIVPMLPGQLLRSGSLDKSLRVMTSHTQNEGSLFANPFITNETAFTEHVRHTFPGASQASIDYVTRDLYPPVFDGSNGYTTQFERTSLLGSEVFFSCNTRYMSVALDKKTHCMSLFVNDSLSRPFWHIKLF